ncbi:hypothetical protein MLD38_020657 [Melastoma candidum]|uniref:Uncharacterized protein n=1 Tax=Melastoma candidum TaxID=119954 RepID=A0ACB9QEV1_9MYRT|nr:hypothetical protein MLD38_020657 [Melastoma candidum]
MKKISKDLEVAKSLKECVMEAFRRQVNAESSAFMRLGLQLDDLVQHFDGIQKVLEDTVKEHVERERLLEEKSRRFLAEKQRSALLQEEIRRRGAELEILETRIKECAVECIRKAGLREEVRMKEEELGVVQKRVKDCEDDLVRSRLALDQCLCVLKDRRIEVESVSRLLEKCCQEYDQKNSEVEALSDRAAELEVITKDYVSKKDKLDSINAEIEMKVIELEAKEKQHAVFQNSINEQLAAFDVRKQEFESLKCSKKIIEGELEAKECESVKATQRLKELDKEIESKNDELASVQGSISELSESLEIKKGELATICCKIEKHNIELTKKQKELESIQVCTERRLADLLLKKKKAASIRKTIGECLDDLQKKKSELNCLNESLFRSTEEVEYRKSELEEIRQESREYQCELEQREKRLDFLQASLDEQCKSLEMNKRIFEEKVRNFERGQRQLQSKETLRKHSQEAGLMACSGNIVSRGQVEIDQSDNVPPGGSHIKAPAIGLVDATTVPSSSCSTLGHTGGPKSGCP